MQKHLYYDRHGRQIPAALALDARGNLKDGCVMRTPMLARDAASHRLTDQFGNSDDLAFSRPGFRCVADAAARDAREAAHREYVDYISNAYKQPQRVRDQDIPVSERGAVDHDAPPHFSRARITDGTGNCSELAFSRPGYRILVDASDERQAAYDAYLEEKQNEWRDSNRR